MDLNPSNSEIVMLAFLMIGVLYIAYILTRAACYRESEPLQGSFTADWGKHK